MALCDSYSSPLVEIGSFYLLTSSASVHVYIHYTLLCEYILHVHVHTLNSKLIYMYMYLKKHFDGPSQVCMYIHVLHLIMSLPLNS